MRPIRVVRPLRSLGLPADYAAADQLVAVVPCGELPCGNAALRLVEEDIQPLLLHA